MKTNSNINEAQFVKLIDDHKGLIYKVSRIYIEDNEDRKDLVQEILLQAWRSINSFNGKSSFSTWLYRVALNTSITYFKKEKPRKNTAVSIEGIQLEHQGYDDLEDRQLAAFYKAVYTLDKIEKALILLHIEGFSGEEIAKNLGMSPGNVRVKLNRTKNELKKRIKTEENGL